jgi:hypothetical protein
MDEKELKAYLDKVYAIGFKNGQIEMKNKVLVKINRDWDLVAIKQPIDLIMEIIKKVDKVRLSKKFTKIKY